MKISKKIILYLLLFNVIVSCFANDYKKELWQKYINASPKENIIPANVDIEDWIKEIRKKTFYIDFFTGMDVRFVFLNIGNLRVSCATHSMQKSKGENDSLELTIPFEKNKFFEVFLHLFSEDRESSIHDLMFKSHFEYAKNLLEIKTFYTENEGKEDEAYVYISTSNKEYKR